MRKLKERKGYKAGIRAGPSMKPKVSIAEDRRLTRWGRKKKRSTKGNAKKLVFQQVKGSTIWHIAFSTRRPWLVLTDLIMRAG